MCRMRTFFVIVVILFGVVYSAEAQFLDRLKKRVIDEAERVVIDKTADKTTEKVGAAMDKVLSPDLGIDNIFEEIGNPMDTDLLPEVYRFDYLYSMKIKNEGRELLFDYLLSKDESYMAMKPNAGADIVMVIDEANNAMVTVAGGQAFAMKMPEETDDTSATDEEYKFTQLPNRTFLGYDCIGYRMENEEHLLTIYFAPDMDASFDNLFKRKQTNIPPQMQLIANQYKNGLVMYMEMEGKNKKEKKDEVSIILECVTFKKNNEDIRIR